jgi:hypothetical protein
MQLASGLASITAALAVVWTQPARAQRLGEPGQTLVFGGVNVQFELGEGRRDDASSDIERDIEVGIAPGAMRFVSANLALGLDVNLAYADRELARVPYRSTEFWAAAGIGAQLRFGEGLSLFPQLWVGAGYAWRRLDMSHVMLTPRGYEETPSAAIAGTFGSGEMTIPLLVQLGRATYLSIGPRLNVRLASENGLSASRVGFTAGFGVFF